MLVEKKFMEKNKILFMEEHQMMLVKDIYWFIMNLTDYTFEDKMAMCFDIAYKKVHKFINEYKIS